jgi:predicted RNA-binding protein associated with RNAse of E/G family
MTEVDGAFEMTDQALDILVDPDGTWRWKDEDDFAETQALGVWTPEEAAAIRAEGERVIGARPWPSGWEDWRPTQA